MNHARKLALILFAVPLFASAAPEAMDMKSALTKALLGPVNGPEVKGVIEAGSPQLKMLSQMTGSSEPAYLTMTKVQDWNRPGCGRLKMVFHQDKMKLKAGGAGNNFYMTQYLDLCSDGSVPQVPFIPPSGGPGGDAVMSVKPGK